MRAGLDAHERRVLRCIEAGLSGERLTAELGMTADEARAQLGGAIVKVGARFTLDTRQLAERLGHQPSPAAISYLDPRRREARHRPTGRTRATG